MDDPNKYTHTHAGVRAEYPSGVRQLTLTVEDGPDRRRSVTTQSEKCGIGAHQRCEFVLTDPTISRFHCEIVIGERAARVVDQGSRNGTVVDGVEIRDAYLREGSCLRLGDTSIRVRYKAKSTRLKVSESREFGAMVGESVGMRSLFSVLERAAKSDATVLIEGETGTGKTMAARAIHQKSARHDGPFIVLDCGAIPTTLLESELFGHERGAFTGAASRRSGAMEEADGGTLFLDEIGELPLELQPKLLGVIEDKRFRRVGSSRTTEVDVRVVAATNRDLREEVNAGRFRSDLYFRLAVVSVQIPPLRERPLDIPILARRTLERLDVSEEAIEQMLSSELTARLLGAAWPGNVRELRNYLERYVIFDQVPMLDDEDIQESTELPTSADQTFPVHAELPLAQARQRAILEFEERYLRAVLKAHGRVSVAAQHAEIDRTHFYRLLRRHRTKS